MKTLSSSSWPILTIGHSSRSMEDFVELLWLNEVTLVVDVRHFPRSRWFPHFNLNRLAEWLPEAGIGYVSLPDLGGKREQQAHTRNPGLSNDLLRGFADYLPAPEFERALMELEELIAQERVALMCAEREPDKCHRSILADLLTMRGYRVEHILDAETRKAHVLTPGAVYKNGELRYPG